MAGFKLSVPSFSFPLGCKHAIVLVYTGQYFCWPLVTAPRFRLSEQVRSSGLLSAGTLSYRCCPLLWELSRMYPTEQGLRKGEQGNRVYCLRLSEHLQKGQMFSLTFENSKLLYIFEMHFLCVLIHARLPSRV